MQSFFKSIPEIYMMILTTMMEKKEEEQEEEEMMMMTSVNYVMVTYLINQEQWFLYLKKQKLNKQPYKTHLKCADMWQNNWYLIIVCF